MSSSDSAPADGQMPGPCDAVGGAGTDDGDAPVRDALFRNTKGKVKPAPVMPSSIADTHAHLNMLADPAWALARCTVHHVDFVEAIVDPAEDVDTYEQLDSWLADAAEILAQWQAGGMTAADGRPLTGIEPPQVRIGVGVHPHNARLYTPDNCEELLRECLADGRTSFLGEIGLDYHYDLSPRPDQREVFARQLVIADELGFPVALHIREAHDEAFAILREHGLPRAGCVLHCFNLDGRELERWLELGCLIAIGGPVTFKKSDDLREAVCRIPADRLLTETDSPYMTPVPLRGTECTPDCVVYTTAMLADVRGDDLGELCVQTYANAVKLFDA